MDLMVDRICRPLGNPGAFTVAAAEFSSSEECAVLRDSIDIDAFDSVTMERDGERVRDVQVLGIDFSAQPEFLDKIIGTLNAVNDLHFRCDLFGVVNEDPPVLVLYRPGQGHYGWHPDAATTMSGSWATSGAASTTSITAGLPPQARATDSVQRRRHPPTGCAPVATSPPPPSKT